MSELKLSDFTAVDDVAPAGVDDLAPELLKKFCADLGHNGHIPANAYSLEWEFTEYVAESSSITVAATPS